jgi:hypothetical protein
LTRRGESIDRRGANAPLRHPFKLDFFKRGELKRSRASKNITGSFRGTKSLFRKNLPSSPLGEGG